MTLDEVVNTRIQYLESLPPLSRDIWISAAHEIWARETFKPKNVNVGGNREPSDPFDN